MAPQGIRGRLGRDVDRWGRADRMPTLLQRVRDEWALERACRAGLRASGREL